MLQTWMSEQKRRNLERLSSERVELNDLTKELWEEKRDVASSYASLFDSRRSYLSEIESKYFKFLDSELQESLIDIQEYLAQLRFEFRVMRSKKEDFCNVVSDLIGKIMKEIVQIRQKIYIGF